MPLYDYQCSKCDHTASESHRMAAAPKGPRKCPACGAKRYTRSFGAPNVKTSKTLKTFAQQSEHNTKQVGREGMEFMERDFKRKRYEAKMAATEIAAKAAGGTAMKLPKPFEDRKEDSKLVKHVNKALGKTDDAV